MTKRILIVDDNSANIYMLKSLLEGEGLDVVTAENGKEALEKARANPPDLIVTDILMPVMDGYALCREWNSDDALKHIPLVFYTATYTELKDEEFALSLGASRFIIKPQEPEIFMNMIKEVLEENYTARQAAAKPLGEEMEFFRRHNEILFKKLEKKMLALESANQRLKISEECYRLSFQNASDVIYTIDADLKLLSISPSVERILGYKPQDFIGRPMSDFTYILTPESYEQAIEDIRLVLQGETNIETIYQFIAKDGTIKYGEVSGAPLLREGVIIGVISVARDITERKQAEEELRRMNAFLDSIVENIPDMIFIKDAKDLRFVRINRAGEDLLGYSRNDLLGKNDYNIFPKDQADFFTEKDHKVLRGGAIEDILEEPIQTLNMGERTLHTKKVPILNAKGEPEYLLGISEDITERKRVEEAMRESEERYRTVFENHAAIKFLIDPDTGSIIEANKAAVNYYGWPHERLKQMKIQEINTLPTEEIKKEMEKARTQKRVYFEFRHRRADGSIRDVEVFSSKIDVKGKDFLHSIVHDITERKKAEGALKESEEKFRSLVEHMHDAILLTKPDGSILDANKAACEMFGRPLDEIKNIGRSGLVDETDPRLHTALRERNRMGTASAEITMLRANGEKFSAEITSTIFTDENGQQKTSMIIRDITERKRAEDTLRKSEARFRSYFELPLIGIAITSPEKGWLEVNDRLSAILGYSFQELKDMTWSELTYPDDLAADVEQFNRVLAGEIDGYMLDKRFIRKDGEVIWTSLAAGCVRKLDSTVDYFVALIQDITAEKESVERIRKTLGAAVHAIAVTVETRDPYTAGHQRRVADLSRAIATEIGLTSEQIDGIRTAAIIHDLGKISVPAEILTRSTKLTDLEFSLIKTHAQSGYDILKDIEFPWPIARMVIEHHERMDGSGYPNGSTGDKLLIESRILSVADVVEAMSSHRPHRPALGIDAALEEITQNRGSLYDPDAVDACLKIFREKGYRFE